MIFKGNAWVFQDNIDTDVIIPARYLNTTDPDELASHCLEDLDAEFAKNAKKGDIIVAGDNFGCGSSREHAPLAIKYSGVGCVIASSFARIFYRNSINIGLSILECRECIRTVKKGHMLEIDTDTGIIVNMTTGDKYTARPFPEFIKNIIDAGGLLKYAQEVGNDV